jgi:UDP-2,3-diacylglucosamine hydrolase
MKRAYFLSDMHLGASYLPDSRQAEMRVVRFLDSIKDDASEIYLLGDVLDYWYEYRYVVPRGYVRFFGKLAELADSGIKITWIIGNHDIWIFDYIPGELGVEVVDGVLDREVLGTRMVMAHGDGVWQSSRQFRWLRALFRNRVCQHMFAAIHPRWTVPFAYSWSRHSRHNGTPEVAARETDRLRRKAEGRGLPYNISRLRAFSLDYASTHEGCRYFLFGHLHQLVEETIAPGIEMIVLGEWISLFSYAVFDGHTMQLCRYEDA